MAISTPAIPRHKDMLAKIDKMDLPVVEYLIIKTNI